MQGRAQTWLPLVAFLVGLGAIFFEIPALSLAAPSMLLLLIAGLILYETSNIIHGSETNYIVADQYAMAKSAVFPNGEVPRYLTNVTLETYDQYSHEGTCMGYHAKATTLAGQDANFSFF